MSLTSIAQIRIAKHYVDAFLQEACDQDLLDKIVEDMTVLKSMVHGHAILQEVIESENITRQEKLSAVAALAKKANFQTITANFLKLLAKNRRLVLLLTIFDVFDKAVMMLRNELIVDVFVAKSLTKQQKDSLGQTLADILDKKIILEEYVSEDILGGMRLHAGSLMIDDSIKTKLEKITRNIKNTNVTIEEAA